MFRGKKEPDEDDMIFPIDSTDNEEQAAVKSAWNLARYGTSWPEILRMYKKVEQSDDEFDNDSLRYLFNLEEGLEDEDFDERTRDLGRRGAMYEGYLVPSENGNLKAERIWPGTEDVYFKYLDSIAEHPLPMSVNGEHPINKTARNYQYWKALKYGKKK